MSAIFESAALKEFHFLEGSAISEVFHSLDIESGSKIPNYEKKRSRSDIVYEYILTRIFQHKIMRGGRITEDDISKELNISNGPIREAFKKLQAEGWVECIPNRGTYVTNYYDPNKSQEALQTRRIIEIGACFSLAEKINDRQLAVLEKSVQKIKSAIERKAVFAYRDADLHFHQTIIYLAGNERIRNIFNHSILQSLMVAKVEPEDVGYLESTIDVAYPEASHLELYFAFAARDPVRVAQVISKHMQYAEEASWTAIRKRRV